MPGESGYPPELHLVNLDRSPLRVIASSGSNPPEGGRAVAAPDCQEGNEMVGARGFEPPGSRTRTVRSTKLSYAPAERLRKAPARRVRAGCRAKRPAGAREYRRRARTVKLSGLQWIESRSLP